MNASAGPADLILHGGVVRTATSGPGEAVVQAMAVRQGRIQWLGRDTDLRAVTGPRTESVPLHGRTVLPGFVDAHVHPVLAGLHLLACDLSAAVDARDCLALIGEHAAAGDSGWILGGGWSAGLFPPAGPDRAMLDALAPDRPVYLVDADQHNAWVNSAALARAGIDASTLDPPRGRIARSRDGTPTGCLHESAADLVSRVIPRPGPDTMRAALLAGRDRLHAVGVTSWQDALVGEYLGMPDPLPAYLDAARQGLLGGPVSGALAWDPDRGPEQVADLCRRRDLGAAAGLRMRQVKIMLDGICENRTAAMRAPYLDAQPGSAHPAGQCALSPADLADALTALEQHGFGAHLHAVGDRAVRQSLDAIATARSRRPFPAGPIAPPRHQIAHVQVVDPADIPRFAELDVTATIQPLWAADIPQLGRLITDGLGAERAGWQYPFGSLRAAGAALAAGSDWPVSSPDPWHGIHVAATRRPSARSAPWIGSGPFTPFQPGEALPVSAAIAAYTTGSARAAGLCDVAGRLAPGRSADLVVLDSDPYGCPPEQLELVRPALVFRGGRLVTGG